MRPPEWRREYRASQCKSNNKPSWPTRRPIVSQRTLLEETYNYRLKRQRWRSATKVLMSRFSDAISFRNVLQTLLECPWATKGLWRMCTEGKLAHTNPSSTAETCLQTMRLQAGQLTIYTDGSVISNRAGGVLFAWSFFTHQSLYNRPKGCRRS